MYNIGFWGGGAEVLGGQRTEVGGRGQRVRLKGGAVYFKKSVKLK
jgi:hypothetical protein